MAIPMTGVEILYPHPPQNKSNTILHRQDSLDINAARESASLYSRRESTLRLLVLRTSIAAFLDYLHTNSAATMRLTTPNYTPFGVNSDDNYVRLVSHTSPQREAGGMAYTLEVTLLFVGTAP